MAWNDEDDYDEEDPCDHEDREIDILDGRARCPRCGESWWATNDEVLEQVDHEARYAEYEEQENRRQWWRDGWETVKSWFRWRKPSRFVSDDDIPF